MAGRVTAEDILAWEDFFPGSRSSDRSIVRQTDISQNDVDDAAQEIWALLVRRLPNLTLEPDRGTLHAWVAAVARQPQRRRARSATVAARHEGLTPELIAVLLDPAMSPAAVTERKQQQAIVQAVVARG